MHELSVAENIIEIIHEHIPGRSLSATRVVRLKIGVLAGIVPESLRLSFSAMTSGTALGKVSLEFDQIPFQISCDACGCKFQCEPGIMVCPGCASNKTRVVGGHELEVIEVELSDECEEVV